MKQGLFALKRAVLRFLDMYDEPIDYSEDIKSSLDLIEEDTANWLESIAARTARIQQYELQHERMGQGYGIVSHTPAERDHLLNAILLESAARGAELGFVECNHMEAKQLRLALAKG